jgi:hypothetical protein
LAQVACQPQVKPLKPAMRFAGLQHQVLNIKSSTSGLDQVLAHEGLSHCLAITNDVNLRAIN